MDRRGPDQELMSKMQDAIELAYLLNKLTNKNYYDDYSKDYLISMLSDMDSIKSNYDKFKYKGMNNNNSRTCKGQCNSCYTNKDEGVLNKIIYFLKSLNDWD